VIVNVFFFPGGQQVLFRVGPVAATAEGAAFAGQLLVRISRSPVPLTCSTSPRGPRIS
jgi:hypothetical protein